MICTCKEVWLPYNSTYEVSSKGAVRHLFTGALVAAHWSGKDKNYLRVNLKTDGVAHKMLVHRLAMLVHKPEGELDTVDHIKGMSNCICNLQWMTTGDNKRKSSQVGGKVLSPEFKVFEFRCTAVFCRQHNLRVGNFTQMLKGNPNYRHTEGWTRC